MNFAAWREYEIDGPYSSNVGEITVHNGEIWLASTSVKPLWQRRNLSDGFAHYIDNEWTFYQIKEYPELSDRSYWDMITINVRPSDEHVFIGSYTGGLVEFDRTDFTLYDESNSSLQRPSGDEFSLRVSGLAFDNNNNLWISNYGAPAPIAVLDLEGNWQSYTPTMSFSFPTQIIVDYNGYKWFAGGQGGQGLLVFDDGGTLNDTSEIYGQVLDKAQWSLNVPDRYLIMAVPDANLFLMKIMKTIIYLKM